MINNGSLIIIGKSEGLAIMMSLPVIPVVCKFSQAQYTQLKHSFGHLHFLALLLQEASIKQD